MIRAIAIFIFVLFVAVLFHPWNAVAQECYTLEESVLLVEESGGSLFDLLPVKNNKQIDNIVVYQISESVFLFGLERGGCIVSYPTEAAVAFFKDTGQPS